MLCLTAWVCVRIWTFFIRMNFATLFGVLGQDCGVGLSFSLPGYFEKYGSIEAAERNATDICSTARSARSARSVKTWWVGLDTLIVSGSGNFPKSGLSWILHGSFDIIRSFPGSFDHGFPAVLLWSGARMLWLWLILGCRGETKDQWEAHDLKRLRVDRGVENRKFKAMRWEKAAVNIQNHDISSNRFW